MLEAVASIDVPVNNLLLRLCGFLKEPLCFLWTNTLEAWVAVSRITCEPLGQEQIPPALDLASFLLDWVPVSAFDLEQVLIDRNDDGVVHTRLKDPHRIVGFNVLMCN